MATWPATLPNPKSSTYKINPVDQTVRTEMEVGYARQRRRTSDRADTVDVQWLFTDAQLDTFRTWFESGTDAQGGAAWFTVTLYLGNTGSSSVTARFFGPPSITAASCADHWNVTGKLEVIE